MQFCYKDKDLSNKKQIYFVNNLRISIFVSILILGMKRFLNILKWTLISLSALILIIPASLYIPAVQNFICQIAINYLNDSSDSLYFELDKIRIKYPLKLELQGFRAFQKSDDSLYLALDELVTSIDGIPYKERETFDINSFKANNIVIGVDSISESIFVNGQVGELTVTDFSLNLDKNKIKIGDVLLGNPNINFAYTASEDTTSSPFEWDINVHNALISDANVGVSVGDLSYSIDSLYLSGSNIIYNRQQDLNIDNLSLRLPSSSIEGNVSANLEILDLEKGFVDIDINGNLAKADLVKFAQPFISGLQENWPEESTNFNVDLFLTPDTIDVKSAKLKIPAHTDFFVSGNGTRPFSKNRRNIKVKAKGDLHDADFLVTTFVDDPKDRIYQLPQNLFVDIIGSFRRNYVEADYKIGENNIKVLEGKGKYQIDAESYSVQAIAKDLVLSDFVPMTGIFSLSTHVSAEGRHFVFPCKYTMLDAKIELDTLLYNNGKGERDSLFNVDLSATLKKSEYFAAITSNHPYIMLDTQLEGIYDKKEVSAQGYIDLEKLDLVHLPQFVAYDLGKLSMQSDIVASYDYGENLFADVFVHTLTYDDGERINPFDEIDIHVESAKNLLSATLESGDASFSAIADQSIAAIMAPLDSILAEFNNQIANTTINLPRIQRYLPNFDSKLSIGRNNSLYPIANLLGYRFNSINAEIKNSESLSFDGEVIALNFDNTRVDSILVSIKPEDNNEIYHYDLLANYYAPRAADSYDIKAVGEVHVDSITTCLQYENGKFIKMYDIDASLALAKDSICLRFTEDPTIYAQKFEVNDDNYICVSHFSDLTKKELAINALVDLDGRHDLCLNIQTHKKKEAAGNEVDIKLENLDLRYLSETLDLGLDINGVLNTTGRVDLLPDTLLANLNSGIENFRINDYAAEKINFVGNLGQEMSDTRLSGRLTINDLVKLYIDANLTDSIDMNLKADELPLPLINAFMPTNFQFSGDASGNLTVKGKDMDNTMMNGSLSMHDVKLNFADCNADIHFPNDTIGIRRNRIRLRDYRLLAANKNPLSVVGSIDFNKSLSDPTLNLTLKGEKMLLFDNNKRKNKAQYIYGHLPATVNMSVRGTVSSLAVSGNVSALEGTNITYYLEDDPLNSISKVDQLVEFVRFKELDRIIGDDFIREYRIGKQEEGLRADLKLQIAQNAKVNVKLPTSVDDHVNLVGGGQLQLNYNPDGSIVMSGMYDIDDGDVYYKLPMLPVAKEFTLSDDSWISWNGNVDEPKINLIAKERVKTTVNDNAGARPVIFDVILNIAGTLNALDMTFNCEAPEDANISSELSSLTEEERSKQALLLLIAQTYMGPGSSSSMGLASANSMLNSLINKEVESLLTNKLKNTDINFGIDTYDTEGAMRTDYSIKVSQRLFNDRVRVSVGGRISSGENQPGQSDAMINDVSLEYLTKEDGSSFLRLFRKTNYQNILEGEIVETGVGYVQQRSGFRFRNLLIPNNKKREAAIRQQIKEMQEAEERENRQRNRNRNAQGINNDSNNIRIYREDVNQIVDTIPTSNKPIGITSDSTRINRVQFDK